MSKKIIKPNTINKKIYINKVDIMSQNNDLENIFIDSNLSFDRYFSSNKIFLKKDDIKDNDIKKIDFIEDKNEEYCELKSIINELNKIIEIKIEKENENKNYKECQEILNILRKPLSNKNFRFNISPFKPLLKPIKISMVGKVFYNNFKDNNNDNSLTIHDSSNINM